MIPENSMQAAKGRKQLIVLHNYIIYKPQDNHKGEVSGIHMLVVTNGCILRLKAHSKERKSWLILET